MDSIPLWNTVLSRSTDDATRIVSVAFSLRNEHQISVTVVKTAIESEPISAPGSLAFFVAVMAKCEKPLNGSGM
jgi:hypothetical protein